MDIKNHIAKPSVVSFPRLRAVMKPTVRLQIDAAIGGFAMSLIAANDELFAGASE